MPPALDKRNSIKCERIRGADNFIALNEHFPGDWSIIINNVVWQGDALVSQVSVPTPGATFECASVFTLRGGKIWRATEYWVERNSEKPPAWHARWTEPLESPLRGRSKRH